MLGNRRQYSIELDGLLYTYKGRQIRQISDFSQIQGDSWHISDLSESISRTMTVDAPLKYADIQVRKAMQESGEFNEPLQIIPHWGRRRAQNRSDLFFTALPVRVYSQISEQIENSEDNILLFPVFAVLFQVVRDVGGKKPMAVIFRHNRFADLIISSDSQVYYVNRCTAFDQSDEQIMSLWNMIKTNCHATEAEQRFKIDKLLFFNWLDNYDESAMAAQTGFDVLRMDEVAVSMENEQKSCSFLKVIERLSVAASVDDSTARLRDLAKRIIPWANICFLLLTVAAIYGSIWYGRQAASLEDEAKGLERVLQELQSQKPLLELPYKDNLEFVSQLEYYRNVDSYKKAVNDVSAALSRDMVMESLKANYTPNEIQLELLGRIDADFDQAYRAYQAFTRMLQQKGYLIADSTFNTEIRQADFILKLRKRVL